LVHEEELPKAHAGAVFLHQRPHFHRPVALGSAQELVGGIDVLGLHQLDARRVERRRHAVGVGPLEHRGKGKLAATRSTSAQVAGLALFGTSMPTAAAASRVRPLSSTMAKASFEGSSGDDAEAVAVLDQPGGVGLGDGQQIAGAVALADGAQLGQAGIGARL
jgi:hypothetical protein